MMILEITFTSFIKKMFGFEEIQNVTLEDNFQKEESRISEDENESLTQACTEEEVWKAIKDLLAISTPGLDGFPTSFYKAFQG